MCPFYVLKELRAQARFSPFWGRGLQNEGPVSLAVDSLPLCASFAPCESTCRPRAGNGDRLFQPVLRASVRRFQPGHAGRLAKVASNGRLRTGLQLWVVLMDSIRQLMARSSCRIWFWAGRWPYCASPVAVTLPGSASAGFCVSRSASMKMKWSGGAAQTNGVP